MATEINGMVTNLVDLRVYNDAAALIGVATVDLPDIQPMTATVSGAGVAGEVEFPVLGHYQSMTCTLHWRSLEKGLYDLTAFKAHGLELRGEQQRYDAATGEMGVLPVRIVLRGIPKNMTSGSWEAGNAVEAETEFEVVYLKVTVGGSEVCEIDKFNYIAKIGGTDYLSTVRADLGLN